MGLWRRDAAKARTNANEHSIPLVFDTPEALCASPEIDAVFIVSPDALHLPHVLLAAKHGKAILCEKPLALNATEVEDDAWRGEVRSGEVRRGAEHAL